MKYLMSEEEAAYNTLKLASWAISNMEMEDAATKTMKPVAVRSVEDVMSVLKANGVEIEDECTFDAWYLYHMCIADYSKSLQTDKLRATYIEETKLRATYIEETICDPDGDPTNVLACFVAKMCNKGIPIMWDLFM